MANRNIFDRNLLQRNLTRAAATLPAVDFLLHHAAQELIARTAIIKPEIRMAADLAALTPRTAELCRVTWPRTPLISLSPALPLAMALPAPRLVASEESIPLKEGSCDLILSILTLQIVNDLPGSPIQIKRALASDGLFMGVLPGGDTLTELRQSFLEAEIAITGAASPRIFPTISLDTMNSLMQRAGFTRTVVDSDKITITYPNPLALMKELKAMGASNILLERSKKFMRREVLAKAVESYTGKFADVMGGVPASLELFYVSGWR